MPLYEYQCGACSHVFEKLQNRNAEPPKTCPDCGHEGEIGKLVSNTSFQLKGSGWYVTDYASGKGSSTASSAPGASSESSASSDSSSGGDSGDSSGAASASSDTAAP